MRGILIHICHFKGGIPTSSLGNARNRFNLTVLWLWTQENGSTLFLESTMDQDCGFCTLIGEAKDDEKLQNKKLRLKLE